MPKQHALSQHWLVPVQQSGPHLVPLGHTHSLPFQVWLPGQLAGFGVGVGRRAARTLSSSATLPTAAMPPMPSKPLINARRDPPLPSARVKESNLESSINHPPELRRNDTGQVSYPVGRIISGERLQCEGSSHPGPAVLSDWPAHVPTVDTMPASAVASSRTGRDNLNSLATVMACVDSVEQNRVVSVSELLG